MDRVEATIQALCRANPAVPEERVRAYVLARLEEQAEREYPASFRSRLGDAVSDEKCRVKVELEVACQCGACAFRASVRGAGEQPPSLIRCHCAYCRKFHASAFGTFVQLEAAGTPHDWSFGGKAKLHADTCADIGAVDRVFCAHCFAKLAVVPRDKDRIGGALLALGTVVDDSIPVGLARSWQADSEEWQHEQRAAWWSAAPSSREAMLARRSVAVSGRCSCGSCRFKAALFPGEVQHCYCNLCRRLSGAASQSWIPCSNEGFTWEQRDGLKLVRTTRHGQRHICTKCGCVMTIVYDSQPDCTWPVAGVLDDATLPDNLAESWYRVIHICCSMMQPWLMLPDDGLPRLKYAG